MKSYHIGDLFKTSWAELTVQEMAAVIDLNLKRKQADALGFHAVSGNCAIMILRNLRKNKSLVSKINVEQAVDCINDLAFITQPWFTFPALSSGEGQGEAFVTPDTHLKNHTLGQLYWIDSLFSKFFIQEYHDGRAHPPQTPSTIAQMFLDEMIAVIYTRPDEFDEKVINDRGKLIGKRINHDHRTCILFTYANVKEFILENYELTFPRSQEQQTDEPKPPKAPVDSEPMWQDLLFDLSESKAYPGMDRAKKAPMYEALNYLEKKHKSLEPKPA